MRGTKAKALRKMSEVVGKNYPEVEYIKKPFKKTYALGLGKMVTLKHEQVFLGKCQRKIYKNMKKIYRVGLKAGMQNG